LILVPGAVFADPGVSVTPSSHDYTDVAVGQTVIEVVTVTSVGTHTLGVSGYLAGDASITMTGLASGETAYLEPGETLDLIVSFSPTAEGVVSSTLVLNTNDPLFPLVTVGFTGTGVADEPPTSVTVDEILQFFDQSVSDGTLVGDGPGNSADGRRKALRNKIRSAGDLIDDMNYGQACEQLADAYARCDGLPNPPEFVSGPAAAQLAGMILDLMNSLNCS
jgi:hypothetical protein